LKRAFPSYGGIQEDVWMGNGPTPVYPQRTLVTPTLTEVSVTKDTNLIDLQSDGISMFRVSSSGDIYGASGSTINTSGADLAERYTSDQNLENGEVVSLDPKYNHGVLKTKYQYQPDVLGVVSTDPGFVTGAYTKNSYPIALVGRVPVKVSTENGMIRAGDFLTAASVPGYAMKASLSGRVIGKALETIDPKTLTDCPASDFFIPGRQCATIMMFVNLIDYNGANVDTVMAEWNDRKAALASLETSTGLDIATSSEASPLTVATSSAFMVTQNRKADEVLAFLTALRDSRNKGVAAQSELFTDRVSAVSQIIAPEIVTGLLSAENVEAGHITGLTLDVDTLKAKNITTQNLATNSLTLGNYTVRVGVDGKLEISLINKTFATSSSTLLVIASTTGTSTENTLDVGTTSAIATLSGNGDDIPALTIDALGNIAFGGDITARNLTPAHTALLANLLSAFSSTDVATTVGTTTSTSTVQTFNLNSGLTVTGNTIFNGGLAVDTITSAGTSTTFMSDTVFIGRPYFTKDTGGFAVVPKGSKSVYVAFDRDYTDTPIVNASISLEDTDATTTGDAILKGDVRYIISNKSVHGFTIRLNAKAPEDIRFSWIALAVKDAKTFTERNNAYEGDDITEAPPATDVST
jgi:hypothetical protein